MPTRIPTLAATLTLALSAAGLAACGDDSDGESGGGGGGGGGYPAQVRDTFVEACKSRDGASQSACECVLDKIEAKVPYEEFMKADAAAREGRPLGGTLEREVTKATRECVQGS